MARQSLAQSLYRAALGFINTAKEERNLQIHLGSTLLVLLMAWFFHLNIWEWVVVLFLCFSIIILELLNTIFEKVVDFMKPQMHSYVRNVKDMMAAVVLVAAIGAALVGSLIFIPHIWALF